MLNNARMLSPGMMPPAMDENVFFADLHHPGGEEKEIERLLSEIPSNTRRIFLLGDTFHYWINELDFIENKYALFLDRLKRLARDGIQLFFLEGNRDFLASRYFEIESWIDVLPNPTVTDLGGRAVYIGHGDELCWNDWAYQIYKTFIRSRPMRFLADGLPAPLRRQAARNMAKASKAFVAAKTESTLEIPSKAYEAVFATGVDAIVHGHVHQTYQRQYNVDGKPGQIFAFGWKDGKRNMIHFEG